MSLSAKERREALSDLTNAGVSERAMSDYFGVTVYVIRQEKRLQGLDVPRKILPHCDTPHHEVDLIARRSTKTHKLWRLALYGFKMQAMVRHRTA